MKATKQTGRGHVGRTRLRRAESGFNCAEDNLLRLLRSSVSLVARGLTAVQLNSLARLSRRGLVTYRNGAYVASFAGHRPVSLRAVSR